MTTIKSYTDIEQSKKLAEILPPESADGGWYGTNNPFAANNTFWLYTKYSNKAAFPSWSLAALLSILPNYQLQTQNDGIGILCSCNGKFNIVTAKNPVYACCSCLSEAFESRHRKGN